MIFSRLPKAIWAIGLVSMFMDISSEMIHALLPVYMVTVLGTSTLAVGMIEGIAEATAAITKVFSGAISDWFGRRKPLAVLGYGLAALTKPVFPLATGITWLVAARFVDRIGKGIRGAPRDALVADISPPELRGASFGLRQSLDTVGAFMGPALAIALMLAWANDYQKVFWVAVIPAVIAVLLMAFAVTEPQRTDQSPKLRAFSLSIKGLPKSFWVVTGAATLLTLARFSEAFLVLRAQGLGMTVAWIPLVLVVMNVAYSLTSYPAGALSDTKLGPRGMLLWGIAALIVADIVLAWAGSITTVMIGTIIWGLHMGLTQGVLASMIAEAAPADLRATCFGVFNMVTGVALLIASGVAGLLWDQFGPGATFTAGAIFAALAGAVHVSQAPRPQR